MKSINITSRICLEQQVLSSSSTPIRKLIDSLRQHGELHAIGQNRVDMNYRTASPRVTLLVRLEILTTEFFNG